MEVHNLKPPFCRQGNKYPLRKRIIPLFPRHITYVEPFAGSAAIFFNKPKADVNVLNDLDKDTVKRLRLLKRVSKDKSKYKQNLTSLKAIKHFFDNHTDSDTDLLLYEKIKACTGFSGQPVVKSTDIYKPFNPIKMLDRINEYQDKLKGVTITTQDYAKVIQKYDSPTTLFFLDPPYEDTSKSFGYAEDTDFNFERLNDILRDIKGFFFMTINDSTRIRKLFSNFIQKSVNVSALWQNTNKIRKELFITNYTLTSA
jgi:DNA adenine methylase